MPKHPSSGKYAIVGLGVIAGNQPDKSERMIAAEAARLAIEDAGLTRQDITGAIDLRRTGGGGDRPSYSDAFTRVLGLNNNYYYVVGRGGALAGLGISTALSFIDRGISDYVCIMGAVTDWSQAQESKKKGYRGMAHAEKRGYWGKFVGDSVAVSHHSWMAARHMAVYGTTSRQLGAISVAQRQWAGMNPEARMHGRPITIEDHQNSPFLAEPYHLLDISLVSDGAVAFILTSAERAKDLKSKPVYVMGQGFGEVSSTVWWDKQNFTHMAVAPAKQQAFGQAGIELKDIDCAQFYDCFTAEVLFQIEDYGFCKKGEGGAFVEAGNMAPGGTIPINTSGGLLSCYHLGDLTGLAESVRQVRGECGQRQVPDCEFVMTTGHGGELVSPGMCSIHTCTILGEESMSESNVVTITSEWKKPWPSIDHDNEAFFEGLKQHKLMVWKCKTCGASYWPKAYCQNHDNEPFAANMDWAPSSGRGKIFAFNKHHTAFSPGFRDEIPYWYALIELDEGPLISSQLVGDKRPKDIYDVGQAVEVVYEDHPNEGFSLPKFRIV